MLVVSLGGSALIRVIGRDEATIRRVVDTLQVCDFSGVIFSRIPIDGTFPMEAVRYPTDTEKDAPDVVLAMRWEHGVNEHGAPGWIVGTGGTRNAGTHGSLSPYDMNNTLIASGPDFKQGVVKIGRAHV